MSIPKDSNLAAEIETVREVYATINRNDIPATLRFFDPQIERVEPEGFPSAGVYRGHAEMKDHLSKGRETWAEGGCEPERFIAEGDKVVAFLHVRVRLKSQSEWIDGHMADVFTFRSGKIIQMRSFAESHQALEWTGIKDSSS